MKKIMLSQGKLTLLNEKDYKRLGGKKVFLSQSRNRFYAKVYHSRLSREYLHRFIMKPACGLQVDHVNGDTLDNRRENLRICTNPENNANKPRHRDNRSGYKGVYYFRWGKRSKRWCARVSLRGKAVYLKYFFTKDEAALAYNAAAKKHFGEFCQLNVVKGE